MISLGLVKGTDSVNPAADAYKTRTQDLQQNRQAEAKLAQEETDRKDREMLRVFEMAGDGYVEEAQYYAKTKGINAPQEVFTNANLAKGLSLAGKIYPGDPAAAQKFTQAWMMTPGDMNARLAAGQQAAGVPVNPDDRMLNRQIAFEQWKLKNVPSSDNSITPYQQAVLDLRQQELDYQRSQGEKQNKKDNYLTVDGIAYSINEDGSLTPQTQPQDNGIDLGKAALSARESAMESFDPDISNNADKIGLETMSFGMRVQEELNRQRAKKAIPSEGGAGMPASSIEIDPMSASNAAIARQQGNIGSNQYQTQERQNIINPTIPPGLPPGSVYIGTSNGYPVYQDPEGNRYIDDGAP